MINSLKIDQNLTKEKKIQVLFAQAIKISHQVFMKRYNNSSLKNYVYSPSVAASELGLDEELVSQLVDDYISQILQSRYQFDNLIDNIKELDSIDKEVKKIELRNLAHKNLGVAKNLRIEDAKIFLNDLMQGDDVELLEECVDALEACAVKLNPKHAFNVLQVMELKNSF